MSYETTDHSLEAYLNMRWPTEEAKVKRDMDGRSRGFAFVSFPSVAILEACFDAAPHFIDGKKVSKRRLFLYTAPCFLAFLLLAPCSLLLLAPCTLLLGAPCSLVLLAPVRWK